VRRDDVPVAAGAGLLDAGANALMLTAVRDGLLSTVAPIAALYPGSTVVLSRLMGIERIGRLRAAGLCLALVGLVLIAV
jgi:drug/metabolite transporter (DMT)-like permease